MPGPTIAGNRRIGLLGGSFDPVHYGHLRMAEAAALAASLDLVLFMVAARSPLKEAAGAAAADRLEMVRRAIAGMSAWQLRDDEVRRGGPSFTVDTVVSLQREFTNTGIHLILGSDSIRTLSRWKAVAQLFQMITPLVVPRAGVGRGDVAPLLAPLGREIIQKVESGWIDMEPVELSSTAIRTAVGAGASITGMVPGAVETYIKENNLYIFQKSDNQRAGEKGMDPGPQRPTPRVPDDVV